MPMFRCDRWVLVPALALASASPALARAEAPRPEVQPAAPRDPNAFYNLVNQGLGDYQEGQYDAAIEAFQGAFKIKQDPKLIFNIARSQEKLGRIDEAIKSYREFVERPGTTAQDRAKALAQIKALRIEKAERAEALPDRPPDHGEGGERADRPASASGAALAPTQAPAGARAAPGIDAGSTAPGGAAGNLAAEVPIAHRSRALEWSLLGGGAAVIAAGGVFGALALSAKNQLDNTTSQHDRLTNRDNGRRDALIADVAIGAGAAAVVAGALLFILRGDEAGATVGLAPTWSQGHAGAQLSGSF